MKTVPVGIQTAIATGITALTTLATVTRTDATVHRFCFRDRDVVYGGQTYRALPGLTIAQIAHAADWSVDNTELESSLETAGINRADILAGRYDYAATQLLLVDVDNLAAGAVILATGVMGELTTERVSWKGEHRGLIQLLQQSIGDIITPGCMLDLGSQGFGKCGKDIEVENTWRVTGATVATVPDPADSTTFTTTHAQIINKATDFFTFGKVLWTSGLNDDLRMEIKSHTLSGGIATIILALPMRYGLAVGNAFTIHVGCAKTVDVCVNKFANLDASGGPRFRGFPDLPGPDKAFGYVIPPSQVG